MYRSRHKERNISLLLSASPSTQPRLTVSARPRTRVTHILTLQFDLISIPLTQGLDAVSPGKELVQVPK